MIVLHLVQNIALLMALAVVHQVFPRGRRGEKYWSHPIIPLTVSGLVFGCFCVVGMMTPLYFAPGVIFDGRSIILSVAGMFGGPVVAVVAVVMCGAYRLWMGGVGALVGVGVICESAALGTAYHYWRKRNPRLMNYAPLWGFGLLVHAIMVASMILLPTGTRWEVITFTGPPVLLVYPLATMVICRLFYHQELRAKSEAELVESEGRFARMFEQAPLGYQSLDADGRFIEVNDAWLATLGYTRDEVIGKWFGDFLAPEYVAAFRERFPVFKAAGRIHSEFEMVHKKGERRFIAFDGRIGQKQDGSFDKTHCILQDITERRRTEQALRESEEKYRELVELANSIILRFDTSGTITFCNEYASRFFGFSGEKTIGRNAVGTIVPATDSEGRDLAEMVREIMAHPERYETNQNENVRKDGTRVWVAWTNRPILDDQGQCVGILAVGNDITERVLAEQEIWRNESRLKRLTDILQYPAETVQDFLDYALSQAIQMTGSRIGYIYHYREDRRELVLNSWSKEVMAECAVADMPACYELDKTGFWGEAVRQRRPIILNDFQAAHPLKKGYPEGHVRLTKFMTVPVFKGNQIVCVVGLANKETDYGESDILQVSLLMEAVWKVTERMRAEHDLDASEMRYRRLFESAKDGILILDADTGRIVDVNPFLADLLGFDHEHFLGKRLWEIGLFKDVAASESAFLELQTKGYIRYENLPLETKDGRQIEVEFVSNVYPVDSTRVVQCNIRDITARRRAEAEIQRMNRSLAMVTACQEALLRATDESELLHAVCDLIVKSGGYLLAWVGYAESDEKKTVRPVAWTGDAEYIRHVAVTCSNEDRGRGPVGTSIREQRPVVIHNTETDSAFRPWRDAALQRGYASVISLPLIRDGRAFGALAIYADHINAFSDAEVDLLSRLVDNVAYGIAALVTQSERERTEEALRQNEATLTCILDTTIDGVLAVGNDARIIRANRQFAEMFHIPQAMLDAKEDQPVLDSVVDQVSDPGAFLRRVQALYQSNDKDMDTIPFKDGRTYERYSAPLLVANSVVGRVWFFHDITERRQAEEERVALEAQFHGAQRMESVGRLAGGVAHDFNNMLAVILGYTEAVLDRMDLTDPLYTDLQEMRKAAVRSADLTRQLLAFARKETVAPQALDLNEAVAGMLKMLQRLIGEDIQLRWFPGAGLWPVWMDPSQIDQILANLCVNARDAIADTGRITIETTNRVCDEFYCAGRPYFAPGEYVLLVVSDNGCGMDRETADKIFEPFFTTKGLGKGTGLGLATVYGIVKQNHGFINVYSQIGQGTVFTIYLPRHTDSAGQTRPEAAQKPLPRGHETILLAEDEPVVLRLTATMLDSLGYTVLAAGTPAEALRLAGEHGTEIALLMTDVVMPEMNGHDLARNLQSLHPHIRLLFMSGYTSDVIAHHGVLEEGIHFMQKPFSARDLANKVREALDKE